MAVFVFAFAVSTVTSPAAAMFGHLGVCSLLIYIDLQETLIYIPETQLACLFGEKSHMQKKSKAHEETSVFHYSLVIYPS